MDIKPVNIDSKFALFSEQWCPKVIAKINDYLVKVGKLQGDFVWHTHAETDELFIVNKGVLRVDFRDGSLYLSKGELLVVPKGVEHRTHADQECELIMFEPETTLNTGTATSDMTVEHLDWI
jgi:mannose-6-phosphate isomerase-like protein (cupin superfamily)